MSVKGLIIALFIVLASFGVANAEARTTSDVDSARVVEYSGIFGEGVVMGYTSADRDVQVRGGDHGATMAEGEKCGGHESHDGGCCHHDCGCNCPGAAYDCWGVWHGDDQWDFASTRDSDYDPVLGDGGRGNHSFFGWGGW